MSRGLEQDGTGRTFDDPRPVPPLGWCAECIRRGTWLRAASVWRGTHYCAQCLIGEAGALLHEDVDLEDQVQVSRARLQVTDALRDGTRRAPNVVGY